MVPLSSPPLDDVTCCVSDLIGDRYRLLRQLGHDRSASVYLAHDVKHGRHVTLKVLVVPLARAIDRERFGYEIAIAAALSHPHVLPMHDSGAVYAADADEPTLVYYVSPYVAGETLRDRLRRAPTLTAEEARRFALEIASALDHAHRRSVVHLGVAPESVLLQEGHAVVADFGLALGADADHDPRTDILALGYLLYEMLVGERPPAVPNAVLLRTHAPRLLAAVVERAMAPRREDRFESAAAMIDALADAEHQASVPQLPRRIWSVVAVSNALVVTMLRLLVA